MKTFNDSILNTRVWQSNHPREMIETLVKECKLHSNWWSRCSAAWTGMKCDYPEDLFRIYDRPWKEGTGTVEKFLAVIRKEIKAPRRISRVSCWSEDDRGELDADRLIHGEVACFRTKVREVRSGPRDINLLCQLGGHHKLDSADLFWQGAAIIAAVDMLEEAGYACEVWSWSRSSRVYIAAPVQHTFHSCRIKEAGQELDVDSVVKSLAGWWFRIVTMGLERCTNWRIRKGQGFTWPMDCPHPEYVDATPDVQTVAVSACYNVISAIHSARQIIEQVEEAHA